MHVEYTAEQYALIQMRHAERKCVCCGTPEFENHPKADAKAISEVRGGVTLCAKCVHNGHDSRLNIATLLYLLAGE